MMNNLLDVIKEIRQSEGESLTITPEGLHVTFTLNRGNDSDRSVMPMDHHCHPERIVDMIKFMRNRIQNKNKNGNTDTNS